MGIKQSKQNPKVIVVFGSIGAGKTTFLRELKKYFEKQGKSVYLHEEVSLRIKKDLDIFYTDPKRYSFMLQDLIIEEFRKDIKIIKENEYDIFLMDRTNKDTKIFTKANISDKLQLEYLRKKLKKEEKINSKYSILIECSSKTCYKRQQKCDRESEEISFEYIEKICLLYKQYAYKLYPDYIIFNTKQIKLENYYKEFSNIFSSI